MAKKKRDAIDIIRERMESDGVSVRRMAELADVSHAHLHRVLTRSKSPSLEYVEKLLAVFSLEIQVRDVDQ